MRIYQLQTLGDPSGIVESDPQPPTPGPTTIGIRVAQQARPAALHGSYPIPAKPGIVPLAFSDIHAACRYMRGTSFGEVVITGASLQETR